MNSRHNANPHAFFGRLRPLAAVLAIAGLLSGFSSSGHAGTLNFYNQPGDVLLMSDGVTALDDQFKFELGTFISGFTPTGANITDWTANWKPFARAQAPSVNGWNSAISYFNKSGLFQLNGQSDQGLSADTFSQGELAYLWIYDDFAISPGGQWALLTNDSSDLNSADNWTIPDPTDPFPYEYALSSALNPVWGGLHNVQGGGDFTAPLAAFTIQTHVVPEPSSVFLVMLAGVVWRVRRARKAR